MHPIKSKEHYEQFLARHYSWIYGGLENQLNKNKSFFQSYLINQTPGIALDLGCGSGFQSLPLAALGYKVQAVDNSHTLLNELLKNARSKKLTISYHDDDIEHFIQHYALQADLIVCMGDTLPHLESMQSVKSLLENCYEKLKIGGKMLITYRDLSNELQGASKYIGVKSEQDKIFSCFLEFKNDHVKVNDIIQQREAGAWSHQVSSYNKILIPITQLQQVAKQSGFQTSASILDNGFTLLELSK